LPPYTTLQVQIRMLSFTRKPTLRMALCLLPMSLFAANANALEGSWHIGFGAGLSTLSPNVSGTGFTVDDEQSTAAGVNLGLDITPRITTELGFTSLGKATLSSGDTVGYQAASLGAVIYVLGEAEAANRHEGMSVYLRLGASSIMNESDLKLDEGDNVGLLLGAGVQYPLTRHLGLRGEFTSFDGDAQSLMASVMLRFGGGTSRSDNGIQVIAPTDASQQESFPDESVAEESLEESLEEESFSEESFPDESEQDSASAPLPSNDSGIALTPGVTKRPVNTNIATSGLCPPNAARQIKDFNDCTILNGTLEGVGFAGESDRLTLLSTSSLDRVAGTLKQYPNVILEIRAHTRSYSKSGRASSLARQRAIAVARYLVKRGIPVLPENVQIAESRLGFCRKPMVKIPC